MRFNKKNVDLPGGDEERKRREINTVPQFSEHSSVLKTGGDYKVETWAYFDASSGKIHVLDGYHKGCFKKYHGKLIQDFMTL